MPMLLKTEVMLLQRMHDDNWLDLYIWSLALQLASMNLMCDYWIKEIAIDQRLKIMSEESNLLFFLGIEHILLFVFFCEKCLLSIFLI